MVFSEINRLFDKVQIKDLTDKFCRDTFKTRIKLPDRYYFNRELGFILPESYVVKGKVDKVLKSSWNYCHRIIRDIDAYVNISEGLGESVNLSEEEVNMIIKKLIKDEYKVDSILDLGVDDRCRLLSFSKRNTDLTQKGFQEKCGLSTTY